MNIVVVLKQTPDTESVIRLTEDGKRIVTDGVKWIINPYDEFAIEAALRLKTKHGGKVTVVSYGPPRVVEALRTALAMGADDAVLLADPALKTADFLRVTRALTVSIQSLNPDVILIGSRAIDYDQGQRGAILAENLGWPHLALAVSLESDGSTVTIERPVEGGKVTLESPLPVLVTVGGSHAIWNPRYASLPGIMKAKKKPLATKTLADLGLNASDFAPETARVWITHLEKPAERQQGRIIDDGLDTAGKARELARVLREEAKVI
ncbi:MAG: electron transfer flavoprotein subunit beta/FixA family protein [Acidobacteriota bacterium]